MAFVHIGKGELTGVTRSDNPVSTPIANLSRRLAPFLLLLWALPSLAGEPGKLIGQFQAALEALAQAEEPSFEARFTQLQPVIERTHDLPFIARLTLGFHWNELDETQRAAFVARFGELSVANYASRFGALDGNQFRVVEEQAQPRGRYLVRAELSRREAPPVSFDYLLHETEAGWRIVNILVDGVSDLALKRAEYAKILRDEDFDALLATLSGQIQRLAAED